MSKSENRKRFAADGRFYRGAMRWMGVGFEFLIVIGLCVGAGYWLDQVEGTRPGWMILGFFVGFGIMLYMMIQRARRDAAEEDAEKAEELEAQLREERNGREAKNPTNR